VLEGPEILYIASLILLSGLRETTIIHWIGAFLSDILNEHIRCRTAAVLAMFDAGLLLSFLSEV
jgi:hypothetical protein